MEAPLALYRRYRPETFSEVIGQDHVTAPLRNALSNNRVNHAYLFSGPRGCGKTTSARILARAINCEKGPIAEPCGVCKSCTDLARGGPGSIDVIEIDAASHGGVDDARDLRERAFFSPVESRYKIYIIDEAHMVTTQGFNALLKLVEEPPPHLKFIFATTEPDKVIGTIRSRTHHYPFRLVPPKVLADYMATLCVAEGVTIAPAALPLVVRAGAGSVRDSLSVLDQLIGGAGPDGVTYELAVALLGFTPDSLLDACVDGFAAHDSRAVFETIEKVIETGQDPKRFAEDLLRRLRDLVILSAVPNAVASGLIEAAEDQGERLQTQAAGIGAAELTRAADIVAAGLLEMRGATAPRLQLELICAKVLLPGADDSTNGIQARLDRVERRLTISTPAGTTPAGAGTAPASAGPAPANAGHAPGGTAPANAGHAPGGTAPANAGHAPGGAPDAGTAPGGAAPVSGGPAPVGTSASAPQTGATSSRAPVTPMAGSPSAGSAQPDSSAAQTGGSGAQAGGVGESTAGSSSPSPQPRSTHRAAGQASAASAPASSSAAGGRSGAWPDESASGHATTPGSGQQASAPASAGASAPASGESASASDEPAPASAGSAPVPAGSAPASAGSAVGSVGLADVRRLWPEILEAVKSKRRFAWIMLSQNAQVIAIDEQTLTLGLVNAGARESFARSGSDEILRQAMIDTIGLNRRVEALVDPSTDPAATSGPPPSTPSSSPWDQSPPPSSPQPPARPAGTSTAPGAATPDSGPQTTGGPGHGAQNTGAQNTGGPGGGPGTGGQNTGGPGEGGGSPGNGAPGGGGSGTGGSGAGGADLTNPGPSSGGPGNFGPGGGGSGRGGSGAGSAGAADLSNPGTRGGGPGNAGSSYGEGNAGRGNGGPGSGGSGGAGPGSTGHGGPGGGSGVGGSVSGSVGSPGAAVDVREAPPTNHPARGVADGASGATSAEPSVPGSNDQLAAGKRRAAEAAVAAEQAKRAAAAPVDEVPLTPEEEAEAIGEDDVILEEDSRSHTDLLRETLGAQIITEEPN